MVPTSFRLNTKSKFLRSVVAFFSNQQTGLNPFQKNLPFPFSKTVIEFVNWLILSSVSFGIYRLRDLLKNSYIQK
ncbi:hypothetical protein LEP1GSC150_3706 [Leptospira interrogans serovar Copenhageni str. LT2050]|uniref:Uncharacterized protein n=1 Tax=Leptospira interrogans serovar Copenhageni str. LT2050 TaxID=1001598 RepID=M3G7J5_LEPIT|nr:hypothetical protein LEP1GSC150_3706 [Leptospira interrogans serovar Copenhageni str. LT2050]